MSGVQITQGALLAGAAAVGVFALGFPVRHALVHWSIIDRPNERSSHRRPTARGGGVAILLAILGVAGLGGMHMGQTGILATLLVAAAVLGSVSFVDDLRSLPPQMRLACHALVALAMLAVLEWPHLASSPSKELNLALPYFLGLGLAFLWMAGYTNAFNFMDGINGLAAGQAALTGFGMGLLSGMANGRWEVAPVMICLVLAGAALGFLPHNFPRARMFMGDVGSAPLGFLLSALAIWLAQDAGWWLLIPLGLLHANFVLDTGITLVRRLLRGERWYEAHREHFYQRFVRAGKTHTWVTLWEMGLQVIVLGLLFWYLHLGVAGRAVLAAAIIAIWSGFFLWAEICFRRFVANQKQASTVDLQAASGPR
jgi:UDP-N-acetylmuramyl pentapeptide phosphotransferase/UDP-N-acetylglucosamine-1-phosphate transferase